MTGPAPISALTLVVFGTTTDPPFSEHRLRSASFQTGGSEGIYGFHAGAQWQWGAWVLGAEAALSGCFSECQSVSGQLPTPAFL